MCVSASDSLRQLTSSHRLPQVRRGLHHSRHLGQARYGSRFSAQAQDAGTGYRALGLGSQSEEFLHPPQNLLVTFSDCPQPLRLSASLTSSRKLFRIGPSPKSRALTAWSRTVTAPFLPFRQELLGPCAHPQPMAQPSRGLSHLTASLLHLALCCPSAWEVPRFRRGWINVIWIDLADKGRCCGGPSRGHRRQMRSPKRHQG